MRNTVIGPDTAFVLTHSGIGVEMSYTESLFIVVSKLMGSMILRLATGLRDVSHTYTPVV